MYEIGALSKDSVFVRLLVSLEKTSVNYKHVANEQEKYSNIDKMQMFNRKI